MLNTEIIDYVFLTCPYCDSEKTLKTYQIGYIMSEKKLIARCNVLNRYLEAGRIHPQAFKDMRISLYENAKREFEVYSLDGGDPK